MFKDKKLHVRIETLTDSISNLAKEAKQHNQNLGKLIELTTKIIQGQTVMVNSLKELFSQAEMGTEFQANLLILYQDILECLSPEKLKEMNDAVVKSKNTKIN